MSLHRAEIVVYVALAGGVVIALHAGVPSWIIFSVVIAGVVAYLAFVQDWLEGRYPRVFQPSAPKPLKYPWQGVGMYVVLCALGALATALHLVGAPFSVILLLVGIGAAFYGYVVLRQVERVRNSRASEPPRGPSVEEWTMLLVSVLFCAALVVIWRRDPHFSAIALLIFGSTLAFSLWVVWRRFRRRASPLSVRIVGGVKLRASLKHYIMVGGLTLLFGAVLAYLASREPVLRWMGIGIAACGLVVLAALPRAARRYLRFDPMGLTCGEISFRYRVAWDNISRVSFGEYANNPCVSIELFEPENIEVEPPKKREAAVRSLRRNLSWVGTHIFLMTNQYGLNAELLGMALERYAFNPAARVELEADLNEASQASRGQLERLK